jgi:hypothetical protein
MSFMVVFILATERQRMISVTEPQLHSILLPAIRYQQALMVRDVTLQRLREICRPYDGVEVIAPFMPHSASHEEQIILVRLLRPAQREAAMVMPYWPELPRLLISRVIQLRLVAK